MPGGMKLCEGPGFPSGCSAAPVPMRGPFLVGCLITMGVIDGPQTESNHWRCHRRMLLAIISVWYKYPRMVRVRQEREVDVLCWTPHVVLGRGFTNGSVA